MKVKICLFQSEQFCHSHFFVLKKNFTAKFPCFQKSTFHTDIKIFLSTGKTISRILHRLMVFVFCTFNEISHLHFQQVTMWTKNSEELNS
jgi:hypothetical protein